MAFELQQLRQVIALAEHGSFVRAAAALHISQPALSRSIQNLERDFGGELFHRSSSGVTPTDRGHLFIEKVRDLLRIAADLEREARADRSLSSGKVAMGAGPFPAESFVVRAATQFLARYPQVSIRMHSGDADELLPRLRSRELDFFVAEKSMLQREPDIEVEPLAHQHSVYFIARADHPLARRANLTATEVLEYPLVSPARLPPRLYKPMLAAHQDRGTGGAAARPLPAIRVNTASQAIRLLRESDVITGSILSCIAAELHRKEVVLLAAPQWLQLDYGIVRLKNRPLSQHAAEFEELIRSTQRSVVEEEARLLVRYQRGARRRDRPGKQAPVKPV